MYLSPSTMNRPPLPRTLILDYYDSYTNNLVTLFTEIYSDAEVLEKVVVVEADKYSWDQFQSQVLPGIDCVILSPGPGRPDNPSDIGFALDLLRLHTVPILGVCLGHQAIGVAFGGKIINTPKISHGHVVPIAPVFPPKGLFASRFWRTLPEEQYDVVVYNSLAVDPETLPDELEVTAWSVATPERPASIQGLRHRSHPIWGVQYHPESISSTQGSALLSAFVDQVHQYHNTPESFPSLLPSIASSCSYRVVTSNPSFPLAQPGIEKAVIPVALRAVHKTFSTIGKELKTEDVFERLVRGGSRKGKEKAVGEIWLDGQTPTRATTASLAAPSFLIIYSITTRSVTLHHPTLPPSTTILPEETTFFDWFAAGQQAIANSLQKSDDTCAQGWQGGWVGWFAYEMKEESLTGHYRRPKGDGEENVDACWGWTDKFLERTQEGEWIARGVVQRAQPSRGESDMVDWIQTQGVRIGVADAEWDDYTRQVEDVLTTPSLTTAPLSTPLPAFKATATGQQYRNKIDSCREAIRQGESYELTLTTSFTSFTSLEDPFPLYLNLREFNPAYYSAYMHFPTLITPKGQGLSVISSSPERFLKIDAERRVEMMPIKGTRSRVKPGQCVCQASSGCGRADPGSDICNEEGKKEDMRRGEELQADQKERAENLMIVDLIRSDLVSCCIPSTVTVPKLIALESYGVHNLVTTVQGVLADNVGSLEAVKRCFPPGSMTGAPKLRSVQLLNGFEANQRRGVYSGALGYISVDGVTDLSVVIRTVVAEGNSLSIGAGGAITWLSDRNMEWEEVLTKVKSVVGELRTEE